MKKGFPALILVLVAMLASVSNALAAPTQSTKNATLQHVTYERGGITLLFHISGLTQSDLQKRSFTTHSQQWNMTCTFGGDTTVRCRVSKHLSMFAGDSFQGTLAGFQFSGVLPSARRFPTRASAETLNETLNATQTFSACPNDQTLWYTFEYSNTSYQAEVWSENYINSNTFYALYGVYPEYTTTTYIDNRDTYYIYSYTASTSGHGATSADNWDALAAAYEADGYTIQKTGESCDLDL